MYFYLRSLFFRWILARLLKVQSELGKQLDSLADMVTFGVAPGIMVYVMIDQPYLEYFLHQDYLPSSWSLPAYVDYLNMLLF